MATADSWRIEKVFLLPVPLRKPQFGAWWAAALDEGLANHGECFWPVDICVDPDLMPLDVETAWVPPAWQPVPHAQRFSPAALSLQAGCILAFRDMEGFLLELHRRRDSDPLTFFGVDARFFDDQLGWKSGRSRDRVLGLLSRAISKNPGAEAVAETAAAGTSAKAARGKALQELLRGKG